MVAKLIHHNQKRAGEKIAEVFKSHNYAILLAQMQSGKTMSAIAAALDIGTIKTVYIISGDSQTALQKQWQQDIKNVKDANMGTHLKWLVCFRHYLDVVPDKVENALFIWDESHTSQTKGQSMEQFYRRLGIEINGDQTEMKARNIYILSISATPISELTCNVQQEQNKPTIFLKTPSLYRGVQYYNDNGLIRPSFSVSDENKLRDFFRNHCQKGYIIMRIRNSKTFNQEEFITPIALTNGFDVFTCSSKKDAQLKNLDIIEKEPTKPTLIFIFGKYRMGQRIIKDHIIAVFEHSVKMHADTALQGLMGRSCGYHKCSYPIYMPQHIIDTTISEFLAFIDSKGATGISNAMNTKRIHPNSPIDYPDTSGNEIFGQRISPQSTSHLMVNTDLKYIGRDKYGDIYELN